MEGHVGRAVVCLERRWSEHEAWTAGLFPEEEWDTQEHIKIYGLKPYFPQYIQMASRRISFQGFQNFNYRYSLL